MRRKSLRMITTKRPVDLQRCDPNFSINLKKLYPDDSYRKATKKLNKVLEELLFGKGR